MRPASTFSIIQLSNSRVNPTAIVGPAIAATAVSTGVAMIFCRLMDRGLRA